MRQHVPNVHFAAIEMNRGNETILVASDIEHHPLLNQIRAGKRGAQFGKGFKLGVSHRLVPTHQRRFAIRMPRPKLLERLARDDMHTASISQFEINENPDAPSDASGFIFHISIFISTPLPPPTFSHKTSPLRVRYARAHWRR